MKAFAGLLAVLLVLGSTALGQTAPDVAAAKFAPGAKVFVDPMGGFGQLLSDSIVHKKVPVVVVKEPANADFVLSGYARVRNTNFITGMVLSSKGGANISMKDARGNLVFACDFHRVDSDERDGDIYLGWADQCAGHLKKALKKAAEKK